MGKKFSLSDPPGMGPFTINDEICDDKEEQRVDKQQAEVYAAVELIHDRKHGQRKEYGSAYGEISPSEQKGQRHHEAGEDLQVLKLPEAEYPESKDESRTSRDHIMS